MTATATGEAALLGRHTWPDHTLSMTCGAGGCWVPNKAWPGIVFSHWGRLEVNHTSNTDYGPDDYSKPFVSADMDGDWRDTFKGHPCFDPKKVQVSGVERGCGWQCYWFVGDIIAAARVRASGICTS